MDAVWCDPNASLRYPAEVRWSEDSTGGVIDQR